jgi:hypothetical protein
MMQNWQSVSCKILVYYYTLNGQLLLLFPVIIISWVSLLLYLKGSIITSMIISWVLFGQYGKSIVWYQIEFPFLPVNEVLSYDTDNEIIKEADNWVITMFVSDSSVLSFLSII